MEELKIFKKNGFISFENAIDIRSINKIEKDIEYVLNQFCNERNIDLKDIETIPNKFCALEKISQGLFYQFSLLLGDIQSLNNPLFTDEFQEFQFRLFEDLSIPFSCTHSGIFYNIKGVKRLQYDWHQERSYFPKHDLGIHYWGPLYKDISETGGPMLIKVKSHGEHFAYKKISKEGALTQLKVADSELKDLEIYKCNINRGDMIIFDHKCVHCTEEVPTKDNPRVAFIRRFAGKSKGEFIPTTSTLTTSKNKDFSAK
tara:strand:+ start:7695 stop:8468 length:774 start_codon:yes stop_codon:yes gene_type:complete